jgi:flagellar motor switch protein FliM
MTKSATLSSDEVSALMAELGNDLLGAEDESEAVAAFSLGAASTKPAQRLAGLDRIGERMARRLRTEIEPLSRSKTQVTCDPIETRRFEDWTIDQREFTSLSLFRLRPLKGNMLIAIEAEFITSLVDAFYGGRGTVHSHKKNEFTPSEERLLAKLTDMMTRAMGEAWGDILKLEPMLASRETNPAYATLSRPDESVIIQRFTLVPGQGRPGMISLIFPQNTLRPVEAQLSSKRQDDVGPIDSEWRYRMACALEQVRLPVRSVLARPELTVRQLMQLKVGDVIPINLPPRVPLLVAQTRLAEGTIGEQEGRAALMIEQVSKGTDR